MRQELGSLVGAIGGVVFIVANAGLLPTGLPGSVRVFGVLAFLAVVWWAVLRTRRTPGPATEVRPGARRTYGICVAAMVVAIPLGNLVIQRVLQQPVLVLPWVILVVGAHFGPFARAFGLPLFGWLSLSLVLVGVIGGVVSWFAGPPAVGWTAVTAGVALLGFSAAGGRRGTPAGGDSLQHGSAGTSS